MNEIKRTLYAIAIIAAAIIMLLIFLVLPSKMTYITGISGNENGDFAVAADLHDGKQQLMFYNNEGEFVKTLNLQKRGGVTIGTYENYLIVRTDTGKREFYDFTGKAVNDVTYSGSGLKQIYSPLKKTETYAYENYSLCYKRDSRGNEYVLYNKNGSEKNIDINYGYYKKLKFFTSMQCFMLFLFFAAISAGLYGNLKKTTDLGWEEPHNL